MRLARIVSRTFFWSYERGAWQYDLAVIAILIFVLLTPRHWFHDQPQVGPLSAPGQVELISPDGAQQKYRVDARVLAPPMQTPGLEDDLHKALQRSIGALHDGRFSIARIDPVRDAQGTVVAYEVEISPRQ
jgi:hypothetical protein